MATIIIPLIRLILFVIIISLCFQSIQLSLDDHTTTIRSAFIEGRTNEPTTLKPSKPAVPVAVVVANNDHNENTTVTTTSQLPLLSTTTANNGSKPSVNNDVTTSNINKLARNTIIQIGEEYNSKPCSLNPPWGIGYGLFGDSCRSKITATHITCSPSLEDGDKPTLLPPLSVSVPAKESNNSPRITIALLYYAKPSALFRQLQYFKTNYPLHITKRLTLLIIDDASPTGLRATDYIDFTEYDPYFHCLKLARITTEIDWNIGGARNLAFYLADPTSRVLLLDLDVFVPLEAMKRAMTWSTSNSTHYIAHRFNRIRPDNITKQKHPAICLISPQAYWSNGGCDEDFVGHYGYTDVHFWYRWNYYTNKILKKKKNPSINNTLASESGDDDEEGESSTVPMERSATIPLKTNEKYKYRIDHLDAYLVEFEQKACDYDLGHISLPEKLEQCKKARKKLNKGNKLLKHNHAIYKSKTTMSVAVAGGGGGGGLSEGGKEINTENECTTLSSKSQWSNEYLRFNWILER